MSRRGGGCCSSTMEMLSLIKHTLVADGTSPICKHFKLGRQLGSAGPEMVWRIYEATRMSDGYECSVFMFEKKIADKIHKPRRREIVTEILKKEVKFLTRFKHPKLLKVIHQLEECNDSLAFATEPIVGSLANFLGNQERMPNPSPPEIKDYKFLEQEIKYGILQIAEGLSFLHGVEQTLHNNVCPSSILINKRGMWKLGGMSFSVKSRDGKDSFAISPWTSKTPKMAQPDLDYIAPEIQLETGKGNTYLCDMFSLGMTICAIYNNGQSLIQANHCTSGYAKRIEMDDKLTEMFGDVAHRMPLQLVEPTEKMINKDIRYRPSSQLFMLIRWFDDPVSRCMQHVDAIETKDLTQKCEFFTKLAQTIPQFPRKILYRSVFPMLREQLVNQDMLVLVLPALISLVEHCSEEDYKTLVQPEVKRVLTMSSGRPVQATVYLLEKLEVLLSKSSEEETKSDVLPLVFNTLESNSIQGQEAAIGVFSVIKKYLDDQTMRKLVLPKAKGLFQKSTNVRIRLNALACIDKLLDSLDKMMILDEVLPFLTNINCQDVDIIMSVIAIYKHMLSDKKFGLTANLLATKVMPTLIPHTATPGMSLDQFTELMEVVGDMLNQIDRQRRSKMIDEAVDMATGDHHEPVRRKSIDMRYNVYDPPKQEQGAKNLLSVDEAYYSKYRPPSTPELQTQRASNESLNGKQYRRHSSFQGLGIEEQAVLEKVVRETQRRASIIQGCGAGITPNILVSEPSCQDFEEQFYLGTPRRASTQSMGPVVVPSSKESKASNGDLSDEPGRRDSRGRLLDALPSSSQRRSSFQGLCESAFGFNAPSGFLGTGTSKSPRTVRRHSGGRLLPTPTHYSRGRERRGSFQDICNSAMQFFK